MKTLSFLLFFFIITLFPSCFVGRILLWNKADLDDYKKFPNHPIHKGDYSFHFTEKPDTNQIKFNIPSELNPNHLKSFEDILTSDKTVAFLIIRNDSIMYENYFDGYNNSAIVNSFSISKSFVSLLTAIAISEAYIKDVHVRVSEYFPELKHRGFDKITLEHLLNMRSGIKFNKGILIPYSNEATYYYGTHLLTYIKHLKIKDEPGMKFEYKSANTLLLSIIISRATGKSLSEYLQEKIWKPIGMESDANWIIDNKKDGIERSFCCISAIARDYAKLGRLCLNKGKWEGKQIVPEEWMEKCIRPAIPGQDNYSYHFWLFKNGTYAANGFHGQYVFVNPNTNTIIVRIGDKERNVNWVDLLYYLSDKGGY